MEVRSGLCIVAFAVACLGWAPAARADALPVASSLADLFAPDGDGPTDPAGVPPVDAEDPLDPSDREPEPELDDFVPPEQQLGPRPVLGLDASYRREATRGGLSGVTDSLERPPRL